MFETLLYILMVVAILSYVMNIISSVVKLKGDKDCTYKLQVSNKLGIGKDRIKVTIDNIPASAAKDLQVNIQPGLSGIDIVTESTPVTASVTIEGNINNRPVRQNYDVPLQGGVRIRPSSSISKGELKVGDIDKLFGQVANVRHIKAK